MNLGSGGFSRGAADGWAAARDPLIPLVGWLGDSNSQWAQNTTQWTNIGYIPYLRRYLGKRIQTLIANDYGVASMGTYHFLNTQVPAAIAAGIKIAYVMIGTNDIGTLTAAQMLNNVQNAIRLLRAAGIKVFLIPVLPQGAWGNAAGASANYTQMLSYNAGLTRIAANMSGVIYLASVFAAMTDATGIVPTVNYFGDFVHFNQTGGQALGLAIYNASSQYFPAYSLALYKDALTPYTSGAVPYGNLFPNGGMAGTSGVLTANGSAAAPLGSIANNLRGVYSNNTVNTMVATFSKGADPLDSSLASQLIDFSGTGDAANGLRVITQEISGTNGLSGPTLATLSAGQKFVFEVNISWSGLTGINELDLRIFDNVPNLWQDGADFLPSGQTRVALPAASSGVLRYKTPPLTLPGGFTALSAELRINALTGAALAGRVALTMMEEHLA